MYNIKEVSELMGISPHTLRYYEKIGLLEFVKRNEQGVRGFSESDLLTPELSNQVRKNYLLIRNILYEYF